MNKATINSKCDTFSQFDKNGKQVLKPKHKFKTDKEAITEAKRINLLPYTIHKFVAYKCNKCSNYHIGKTNKEINK